MRLVFCLAALSGVGLTLGQREFARRPEPASKVTPVNAAGRSASVQEVPVPDDPLCARCTIASTAVIRIRGHVDAGRLNSAPNFVASDSRGRIWVAPIMQPPLIFDSAGRFMRALGPSGAGRSSFGGVSFMGQVPGDSMLVVDGLNRRAVTVSPTLAVTRVISAPFSSCSGVAVARWPDRVVCNAVVPTEQSIGLPLHLVSMASDSMRVLRSFGPEDGQLLPGKSSRLSGRLADDHHGFVWMAETHQYRLTKWSPDGALSLTLRRAPEWFKGLNEHGLGGPTAPPDPSISGLWVDGDGFVWVVISRASSGWRSGWPAEAQRTREIRSTEIRRERMFESVVEVIDPRHGRIVARTILDAWVVGVFGDGRVATYRNTGESGSLSIQRLSLVRQ